MSTNNSGQKIKIIDIRNMDDARINKTNKIDNFLENQDMEGGISEFDDFEAKEANENDEDFQGDEEEDEDEDDDEEDGDGDGDEDEEDKDEDDDEEDGDDDEDDEEDEDEDGTQDGGASDKSYSTTSTTRMLSEDPLFLVLSEYLVNKKGENIVTVLDKINSSLNKLSKSLSDIINHKKF